MKVVFLEEVEGTARAGDVKNVADGFARNFLLPRKLAAPATDHYINIAHAKAGKEARKQDRLDEDARTHLLSKVDGKSISIEVRVGEQDKLFGSVTARDIAEALQAATKVELEHRQVVLKEPIRELGEHAVTIKLTRNVQATVTVSVEPLGGMLVAEAPAAVEMEVADDASSDELRETAEDGAEPDTDEAVTESSESEAERASEES
jgi:large subunit ribosomal protein L9